MSSNFTFPSPVGGVPFQEDFAPSILFAVLYGLLIPLVAFRLAFKKTRTFIIFSTLGFSVERVAIFALRSLQSRNDEKRVSDSLTRYMQISWAVGFTSLAVDLLQLLRCLLVNATMATDTPKHDPVVDLESETTVPLFEAGSSSPATPPAPESITREKERTAYRLICTAFAFFPLVPIILGAVSGNNYVKAEHDPSQAQQLQQLRYASTGISLFYILGIQCLAIYAVYAVRGISKRPTLLIVALSALLSVVAVYRLVVMRFQTTFLGSEASGSLSDNESHALFYVFHIAPEFLTSAVLLGVNVRKFFGTGLYGDVQVQVQKKATKADDH